MKRLNRFSIMWMNLKKNTVVKKRKVKSHMKNKWVHKKKHLKTKWTLKKNLLMNKSILKFLKNVTGEELKTLLVNKWLLIHHIRHFIIMVSLCINKNNTAWLINHSKKLSNSSIETLSYSTAWVYCALSLSTMNRAFSTIGDVLRSIQITFMLIITWRIFSIWISYIERQLAFVRKLKNIMEKVSTWLIDIGLMLNLRKEIW